MAAPSVSPPDRRPLIIGLVTIVVLAAGVALVLNGAFGRGGAGDDALPDLPGGSDGAGAANGRAGINGKTWVPPDTTGHTTPPTNGGNTGNGGAGNQTPGTQIMGSGNNAAPVIDRRDTATSAVTMAYRGMLPDVHNQPRVVLELRATTANPQVRAIDLELIAEPEGLEPVGEVEVRRRRVMPGSTEPNVVVQTSRTPDGLGVRLILPDGLPTMATLAVIGFRVADRGGPEPDATGIRHHRVRMVLVRATLASGTVEEWPGAEAHVRFRPTE